MQDTSTKVSERVEEKNDTCPYLKQCLRISNNVEQPPPSCHLCLARASHNHIEVSVEVVEEFNHLRQDRVVWIGICVRLAGVRFDDCVEKYLQRVRKVY